VPPLDPLDPLEPLPPVDASPPVVEGEDEGEKDDDGVVDENDAPGVLLEPVPEPEKLPLLPLVEKPP
jgi:hypothetical protein